MRANSDPNSDQRPDFDIHCYSYRYSYIDGDSFSYSDSDSDRYSYSYVHRDTIVLANMRPADRRIRRYHDVNWSRLGADQPQHGGGGNQLVPGK